MSPSNERLALYASLTLVLVAVVGVFAYTATRDDDPVGSGASVAVQGEAIERGEEGEGAEPAGEGAAPTGEGEGDAPGTAATAPAMALDLDPADMDEPPQEPVGVYRQGTIILGGSVPNEEVAMGYVRKAAAVIGEENIIMHMAIDPRVTGESLRIDVDAQFRFGGGSLEFDPAFAGLLDLGAAALQLWPEATLVVTGHTDSIGDEGTNLALSRARAQVVVDWMVDNGLTADRVVARGVGETEPVATNDTPEGREANRRIEASMEGITPLR